MKNILVIRSSVNKANSVSNQMIDEFVAKLQDKYPTVAITERDLNEKPVPTLSAATVNAVRAGETDTPVKAEAYQLANTLVDEIKSAQAVVMGVPMYNFGVPATLKAYVDYIARPRVTFAYSEDGPHGLLPNIPVYAFISSAGLYEEGKGDFMSPWLRQVLGFVGLNNVNVIKTEGFAFGEEAAAKAFADIRERINEIISSYQ